MMYLDDLGPEKSYSHIFDKYFELWGGPVGPQNTLF